MKVILGCIRDNFSSCGVLFHQVQYYRQLRKLFDLTVMSDWGIVIDNRCGTSVVWQCQWWEQSCVR